MNEARENNMLRRWLLEPIPTLDREEAVALLNATKAGVDERVDFNVMMLLATTLASLGLLQGNAAVVIGAMLVAPLMGPLVAAGLAIIRSNLVLFRRSLSVCFVGIGIGLVASMFFGVINPGIEPSMELEARTQPDVLDLVIAFVSGMVAAYAAARPKVAATLAGVAIAAALLPPLAVVGIGLTSGLPAIAGNAAILFVTNLVAIVLGAALVFRMMGLRGSRSMSKTRRWSRRATMVLSLFAVILAAPLVLNVVEKNLAGQARPYTYPVSADVNFAVRRYLRSKPEMDFIAMARIGKDSKEGINVILSTRTAVPYDLEEELTQIIRQSRGDDEAVVRTHPLLEAREARLEASSISDVPTGRRFAPPKQNAYETLPVFFKAAQ